MEAERHALHAGQQKFAGVSGAFLVALIPLLANCMSVRIRPPRAVQVVRMPAAERDDKENGY
jgi:hypothetical protein